MFKIASKHLVTGDNEVVVDFVCKYSEDCTGITSKNLDSITELTGNNRYIFGWNEFYGLNRMFPNMEQPDIRGQMKLYVAHPQEWRVISNENKRGVVEYTNFMHELPTEASKNTDAPAKTLQSTKMGDHLSENTFLIKANQRLGNWIPKEQELEFRITEFCMTSVAIPSYLFTIFAGDFIVEEDVKGSGDAMKNRLLGPKHQAPTLKAVKDMWFTLHNQGRDFLESLLGAKLPFQTKYDSIICPGLTCSFGACEYPGAVIFAEDRVECNYKGFEYARMGTIIIHEMGHMWFGNWIPIHWWNDLYVKEAMADYVSYLAYKGIKCCQPSSPRKFTDAPPQELWFAERKTNGMIEDLIPELSKALRRDFKNSCQQETMYTKITYGKSFSMLHEMFNFLGGSEFFSDWAKNYISTYQTKSTGSDELGKSVVSAYKTSKAVKSHNKDGELWTDKEVLDLFNSYCLEEGIDTLSFAHHEKENAIVVKTSALKSSGKFRRHYFDIALYDTEHKLIEIIKVSTNGEETTVVDLGEVEYANFLPNYSNLGYFWYELSEDQVNFFTYDTKLYDVQTMSTFNQYYFLSLLFGENSLTDYVDFACDLIANKPKEFLFCLTSYVYLGNLLNLTTGTNNDMIRHKVYDTLAKVSWPKEDFTCLDAMLNFAYKGKCADLYLNLFTNTTLAYLRENLSINSLTRWCLALIRSKELKKDQVADLSARLRKGNTTAWTGLMVELDAKSWNKEDFENLWNTIVTTEMRESEAVERLARRRVLMQNLVKVEFKGGYIEEYFKRLPDVFMQFDTFTCKKYLDLMPKGKPELLIEYLVKIAETHHFTEDEEDLLRRQMTT